MTSKKFFVLGLIAVLMLSGCGLYQQIYAQNTSGETYVPIEEIKAEGGEAPSDPAEAPITPAETPPTPPEAAAEITPEEVKEAPEEVKEVGKGEAIVIIVQETAKVSLVPKAEDPDKDKLVYTFTTPLDENGEWQTGYGDAGEYTITVTASDSELTTSKDALIIVNKKEEVPAIDTKLPESNTLAGKEDSSIEFSVKASDLNKDPLAYTWKLDGNEVSTKESYTYEIGYDQAGSHTVKLDVSDGTSTTSNIWSVSAENVNRLPVLNKIDDITVKETEKVVIAPSAADPDDDTLAFTISDPVGDDGLWETTYDDAGEYTVTVTVSDGEDSVSQQVKIIVNNVNRPPVISDIVQR